MTFPAFALPLYYSGTATTLRHSESALYYALDERANRSSALLGAAHGEAPGVVLTSTAFYEAVARVLPIDEEADRRIDALVARQPRRAGRRPVARR